MAMFGFVYLWYLMVVLVLEIWLDYRKDIVLLARSSTGWTHKLYRAMALWSDNISERSLEIDDKVGKFITVIGIPSAFLLHGYVGFIFGSIKANPWWSTPLMPIVFLFSAIVSGIVLVMLMYMVVSWIRRTPIDMRCLDTIGRYFLYAFIIDFSLEMLDLIHRIYEADESFKSLDFMVHTKLYFSQVIIQIIMGTVVPILILGMIQLVKMSDAARKGLYVLSGSLAMMGIFAMRWNVVIGGQLFSKSLLGYTTYKMGMCDARRPASLSPAAHPALRDPLRARQAAAPVAQAGRNQARLNREVGRGKRVPASGRKWGERAPVAPAWPPPGPGHGRRSPGRPGFRLGRGAARAAGGGYRRGGERGAGRSGPDADPGAPAALHRRHLPLHPVPRRQDREAQHHPPQARGHARRHRPQARPETGGASTATAPSTGTSSTSWTAS